MRSCGMKIGVVGEGMERKLMLQYNVRNEIQRIRIMQGMHGMHGMKIGALGEDVQ